MVPGLILLSLILLSLVLLSLIFLSLIFLNSSRIFASFILCLLLVTSLQALTLKDKTGVGLQVGPELVFIPKVFRKDTKLGVNMGAHIRHHFTERSGFDVAYDRSEFLKSKVAAEVLSIGYRYRFRAEQNFSPILKVATGLGLQRNLGGETNAHFLIEPGIGMDYFFAERTSFDADVDYRYFFRKGKVSSHTLPVSLGFTYYFGGNSNASGQAANSKSYTRYPDANLTANPGDAIKDSDRDGIQDQDDRCSRTKRGAKVDADGCRPSDKTTIDLKILFKTASAEVPSLSLSDIESAAQKIKDLDEDSIEVEGHTDNTGNEAKNVKLSQARAEAVKSLLVSKYGVAEKNIRATGFGSARPKGSNDSVEDRKQNRRVSLVLRK